MKCIKIIVTSFFLLVSLKGQDIWYEGNLKGLDEFSLKVVISGLDDNAWEKKANQLVIMFLEQYKVDINLDKTSPVICLNLDVIHQQKSKISSYNLEVYVMDFITTENKYIKSFEDNRIIKKFGSGKIYEHQILGQIKNEKLTEKLEKLIIVELDKFINQWFQDNPMKQF